MFGGPFKTPVDSGLDSFSHFAVKKLPIFPSSIATTLLDGDSTLSWNISNFPTAGGMFSLPPEVGRTSETMGNDWFFPIPFGLETFQASTSEESDAERVF